MSVFTTKPHGCACGCTKAELAPESSSPPQAGQDLASASPGAQETGVHREIILLVISGLIFALSLFFETAIESAYGLWAVRLAYAIPYLLCGLAIFRAAYNEMRNGDFFNEFALMCIATVAAIGLGELAEAVGVMLFYRLGEFFQEWAASGSRRSITSLLAAKPSLARLVTGSQTQEVQVEEVAIGDTLEVRAGEKIPLDSLVMSGESQADQSPLTGESMPVRLSPGMKALAGSINLSGTLRLRAVSLYADSHMARILDMVEHASQRKSPTERFIRRFARWYTPTVVALATLIALAPPLLVSTADFATWLYRALVLLIISCPCALLISIPLSYFGGIGAASRFGVLVKGGNVLDGLLQVNTVVFDKTGTLTEGRFSVAGLYPVQGIGEDELLRAALIAERHGSHPIAQAVCRYGQKRQMNEDSGETPDSDEYPGKGMAARFGGALFLAGTKAFLAENGIAVDEGVTPEQPGAFVYVACQGRFLGFILVTDTIKADAAAAIIDLKEQGLATFMLTGDHEKPAAWVAKECGLDGFRAELLPAEKVAALSEICPTRPGDQDTRAASGTASGAARAAFVGDGINDAPILALSRVGIAMGGIGSAAAIEAADAVIMGDSPAKVAKLFRLAKDVRVNVYQNIALALGVKAAIMALGIAGISGLWEAIFADVGVAVLAVLNTSRLMRKP